MLPFATCRSYCWRFPAGYQLELWNDLSLVGSSTALWRVLEQLSSLSKVVLSQVAAAAAAVLLDLHPSCGGSGM